MFLLIIFLDAKKKKKKKPNEPIKQPLEKAVHSQII